jgi:hypothetical protein
MTVTNNQSKYIYLGNGTTGPWNYPRYFIQDADLIVTKTNSSGVETKLTGGGIDYAVTGAGLSAGGFVTTTANIVVGEKITVSGNVDYIQADTYPEKGLLPAKVIEKGLDRLTMMAQQINEKISRSLKLKISSTISEVIVDDPIEGNILAWISGRLGNITGIAAGLLTAFYQDASNNVSVGRPGSVTAGHKLDVNGKLFVQNGANINTNGDITGTDSINTYGQVDAYQPNSAMGAVGSVSVPGISPSSSRGTGTVPTLSLANDLLGGTSMYAYSGASPAYNCHAAIVGRATGATANNLGGAIEFYTKADNGALTQRATLNNAGIMNFVARPTIGGVSIVDLSAAQAISNKTLDSTNILNQVTINQPNIVGVTTNSNAAAGSVGEIIEATLGSGSATALTNATPKTITQITVTPGDWDLWGVFSELAAATTTVSLNIAAIGTVNNTLPSAPNGGAFTQISGLSANTNKSHSTPTGTMRVSVAVNTTYYLIGYSEFAISTLTGYGYLAARRAR